MNIKKYSAPTMREALEKVKGDLGKEAVILQTRSFKTSRFLGMGGREMVEITATLDEQPVRRSRRPDTYNRLGRSDASPAPEPRPAEAPVAAPLVAQPAPDPLVESSVAVQTAPAPMAESTVAVQTAPEIVASPPVAVAEVAPPEPIGIVEKKPPAAEPARDPQPEAVSLANKSLESLQRDVVGIKAMVQNLVGKDRHRTIADLPYNLMKMYQDMCEGGVEEITARGLVVRLHRDMDAASCRDRALTFDKLRESIRGLIRVAGPIKRNTEKARTVALIGPTGVGKTTTIAKLAADFKLNQKLDVGLITIDTYRIAAVEQLRVYADIIGVPLNVVLSPTELAGAIAGFADKDVVLIDTAGRSQMDEAKMTELKTFLHEVTLDEVHLVISATTHPRTVANVVDRFAPIATDQMIITKTDEIVQPGSMLNVITKAQKAISYVTNGQEVPEDIEVGSVNKITDGLLGAMVKC